MKKVLLVASMITASSFNMYAMLGRHPDQQQSNHARREDTRERRPEYEHHPRQYPGNYTRREGARERSPEYGYHPGQYPSNHARREGARERSPEYRHHPGQYSSNHTRREGARERSLEDYFLGQHQSKATVRKHARELSPESERRSLSQQQGNSARREDTVRRLSSESEHRSFSRQRGNHAEREDAGILTGGYELIKGVSELAIGSCGIITLTAGVGAPFLSGYLWYPIYNVVSTINNPLKAYLITSVITSGIAASAITVGSLFLLQRTGKWLVRTSLDGLCNAGKGSFHLVKGVLSWPFGHCSRRT